jgi:hypothetical protein
MEFVGPLENVRMGSRAASQAGRIVPLFWAMKRGHWSWRRVMACSKERIVDLGKGRMEALRSAAFSRSMKPRLATVLDVECVENCARLCAYFVSI